MNEHTHSVKVLRGGSWNNVQRDARCACRDRYRPDDFDVSLGVRVMRTSRAPATLLVVRGSSWYSSRRGARCAYRFGDPPDVFGGGIGFRVMKTGGKV